MRGIVKGALLSGIILGVALAGCSQKVAEPDVKEAIAVMNPTEGSKVRGAVSFVKDGKGVRITANIEGLSPGPHGFHIHEFGNCTSPEANSAGGHFNPTDMPHAGPKAEKRHAGDLGNLEADKNGLARLEVTDNIISLEVAKSVIGRRLVHCQQSYDMLQGIVTQAKAGVQCF